MWHNLKLTAAASRVIRKKKKHLKRLATQLPYPVRNQFTDDPTCLGRSKSDGQMVVSMMREWLTTIVTNHSLCQADSSIMPVIVIYAATGHLESRRADGLLKRSVYKSRSLLWWILASSMIDAFSQQIWGGAVNNQIHKYVSDQCLSEHLT